MKCPKCNKGILKKGMTSYSEYGIFFGKYPADICTYCKEAWFDEDVFDKIQRKSKKLGLFGLGKKVKASYENGILKVKLPKEITKDFPIKNPSIIVEPIGRQKFSVKILTKK